MSRNINPAPQHTRGGKPVDFGKLFYFETGTNTPKKTFADNEETIVNTNPVILDAEGVEPNIFYSGIVKQILTDKNGVQLFNRDPVGADTGIIAFEAFSSGEKYAINNIVTTDNRFFKSVINNNKGFSPVSDDGTHWQEIDFNNFFASGITYKKLASVISQVDSLTYISVVDSNKGNEPSVDDGSKWVLDNPTLIFSIGKTYIIGEKAFDDIDNRTYKAVIEQAGNQPSADDGTNWLPTDGVVDKPTNVTPADLATDVPRSPTLTSDAYSISGSNAAQEYSRYQIATDSGFLNIVDESGITTDLTIHTSEKRLEAATLHFWRKLDKGIRTDLSEFSDATSFTTTIDFSEIFDDVLFNGTGAVLSVITTVDLNSNSGSVWINNNSSTSNLRIVTTLSGVGKAVTVGLGFNEVAEPNGLTAFNFNGFNLGNDVNYNNIGDPIYTLSFKVTPGNYDIISTSGTGINRTDAHNVGVDIAFMVNFQLTGSAPGSPRHRCWFKGMTGSQSFGFGGSSDLDTNTTIWNSTAPTSTTFSLGTSTIVNGSGRTYQTHLLAHNPPAGMFGGSYTGTGTSGNFILLGDDFNPVTIIWKGDKNEPGGIFDKKIGTSSHIEMGALDTSLKAGGPESFNSNGFTVGATANDLGIEYFFFAMSDPS